MKKNNIINLYTKIYNLDIIKDKSTLGNLNFLPYCDKNTFLINDNQLITYCYSESNNINYYIKDIENKYNIKVISYYPICFTENNGIIVSCKIVKHSNLLLQNNDKDLKKLVRKINYYDKYYNDEVEKEYFIIEKYKKRYDFYRKYIKKYWLTEKRRKKKEFMELLKDIFKKYDSIIDVSCGDNEDIFKMAKNASLVVGNDINMSEISRLCDKYPNCLFTTHNIIDMPFKNKIFDIAYCKNTFHHLNGQEEIAKAIKSMCKISKKAVIIDIENPKDVSLKSKLLNKYLYVKYLKDNYKKFLNYDEFKNIIKANTKGYKVEFKKFSNILGRYMIAIIEER